MDTNNTDKITVLRQKIELLMAQSSSLNPFNRFLIESILASKRCDEEILVALSSQLEENNLREKQNYIRYKTALSQAIQKYKTIHSSKITQ